MELYERYGHSASDVIWELGCPLRLWHREWLEERACGQTICLQRVEQRHGEQAAVRERLVDLFVVG